MVSDFSTFFYTSFFYGFILNNSVQIREDIPNSTVTKCSFRMTTNSTVSKCSFRMTTIMGRHSSQLIWAKSKTSTCSSSLLCTFWSFWAHLNFGRRFVFSCVLVTRRYIHGKTIKSIQQFKTNPLCTHSYNDQSHQPHLFRQATWSVCF